MPSDEEPRDSITITQPPEDARKGGAVAAFLYASGAEWTATGEIARGPRGLLISRLEVQPGSPEGTGSAGVTSRILRAVPVGDILAGARTLGELNEGEALRLMKGDHAAAERLLGELSTLADGDDPRSADEIIATYAPANPGPGRAPLPDELMRAVAEGYLAETAQGKPRGAVKRLAASLGRPEQTVSRWIARARRDGWLGPGSAGREGAEPGPRLISARSARGVRG